MKKGLFFFVVLFYKQLMQVVHHNMPGQAPPMEIAIGRKFKESCGSILDPDI
jgi:hypothetical protein